MSWTKHQKNIQPQTIISLSQLKYVFRFQESVSHAVGQNSPTPKENNDMNFELARDQVVLLETVKKL